MTTLRNIHSTYTDYEQIAQFYDEHKDALFDDIPLSLSQWFDANMAAPLGAVLDLLEGNLNDIVFNHIDSSIKSILQKNGFLSHFGFAQQVDVHGTTIQYQKMKPTDGRYFREYVAAQFLHRHELPNMSDGLRKKMTEAMLELFVNAQIHSETKHIYTCGQFFPARHTIVFSIVDIGIGFAEQFRRRFSKKISAVDAIRWAVEDRHTTKLNIPGGIGLALLREFVSLNNGLLQIVSHDGFYQYDRTGEKVHTLNKPFPGSIVSVLFRTNDRRNYSLLGEDDVSDLF
ncbi:ATP-binding protein [Sulfuriferula thiophila]|uniref:ATP-binding protein n=1 Tax=Sulfuriferula thiophila TaxID=1781211 RepID=UPI000F60CA48|nr:ATP-binding protein [Sulfuriferula thiophila]